MEKTGNKERPPVIVIMGHVDHGKSALLDYIRKTNVVESEAGGITQHISAYEVNHKTKEGKENRITFLDTPGHESFASMRERGSRVADIAVLVVSAEEGVKKQTLEALSSIKESGIPYIIAINKIDLPGANIDRTKDNLLENEIYLEGLGGDIPWVAISAKTGVGVPELLNTMLLVAELEELKGDGEIPAEGVIIESELDPRKGISATLVIKDGTLKEGMCISSGDAMSPVRIMEDFTGKKIKSATFSSPIRIIGFNKIPQVGTEFKAYDSKKEAEAACSTVDTRAVENIELDEDDERVVIPIILKADVLGSIGAINHEIEKIKNERVVIRVVQESAGDITEGDVKVALVSEHALIIGFNVGVDNAAKELALRHEIEIHTFDIIYKLAEWLEGAIKEHTPQIETEELSGSATILKVFGKTKGKQVVGGRVSSGALSVGNTVMIKRRDNDIGEGTVTNLQSGRADAKKIEEGQEFGAQIESKIEIAEKDSIESFIVVKK
ncbi:MAG: translation initiation factor IF-2 [Candidatus Pacebacteria bacterium]|jgi:translation initiation factor IF-2|nr:translation initiation factor IF-2 [bacterium]MDP6527832.1 translation initiation factor IF-2 [Candidatus Paceibacterota bacterium]MDP6659813.1 translation initiation factor IF-2 [Candidatus Paceibacterota bacterium]|tara:strand:- start:1577 stop:3070 length:1494 start_codon:yes stop_codon:yes gene_type:complete